MKKTPTGTCHRCSKPGHYAAQCTQAGGKVRSHAASLSTPPSQPCPVCNEQHIKKAHGSDLYLTRLSGCVQFRNLDPAGRARVLKAAQGCVLCLDWTGGHKASNCPARTKDRDPYKPCQLMNGSGQVCGKRHNQMLHGASSAYCNHTSTQGMLVTHLGQAGLPIPPVITMGPDDKATIKKFNRAPTSQEIDMGNS